MNKTRAISLQKPSASALLLIDYQVNLQKIMRLAVTKRVLNSISKFVEVAQLFQVPAILTIVRVDEVKPVPCLGLSKLLNRDEILIRSSVNALEDPMVRTRIREFNRQRLLLAGLTIDMSLSATALAALEEGFDVYLVSDATGELSEESRSVAFQRLLQAGVVPITWPQIAVEWQNDWSSIKTACKLRKILREHKKSSSGSR